MLKEIDELRSMFAEMSQNAKTEDEIKKIVQIDNKIKEVADKHEQLEKENKNLLNDYKDVIKNYQFNGGNSKVEIQSEPQSLNFNDSLAAFLANLGQK